MESGWDGGRQNCLNLPPLSTVLERYEGRKFPERQPMGDE
jgi:hypothetical protein